MKKKTVLKVFFSVMTVFLALTCTLASIKTKKIKADTLSDLKGTIWTFNNDPVLTDLSYSVSYSLYFHIENSNFYYNYLTFGDSNADYDENMTMYYDMDRAYDYGSWLSNDYKTIYIDSSWGGSDATNSTLISWLQNNATLQNPTPPTPAGTEITHRYWASYGDMIMTNNQIVGDNDITYTVLLNSYSNDYRDQTLTGLAFTGLLTNINDEHSYIISPPNEDILYQGTTNSIDNPILLEFTIGDYMDSDLYDLMEDNGVWFDDARVYMAGTSFGSIYGFNTGRAYGQAESLEYSSLITTILNGIGSLLSIQIFPHITIALILGLPLLLGVFVIIIKILRG